MPESIESINATPGKKEPHWASHITGGFIDEEPTPEQILASLAQQQPEIFEAIQNGGAEITDIERLQ